MKGLFTKCITDRFIIAYARLIKKSSRIIAIIVVFAILATYVPWSLFKVNANEGIPTDTIENTVEEEQVEECEEEKDENLYKNVDIDPSLVPIDYEVIEKRTETEKHFKKIDGTYEAIIYDYAVHFSDNGEWTDIDNTLNDLGTDYENKKNNFKVKLPKILKDNKKVKIKLNNYEINWRILDINDSAITVDNSIIENSKDQRVLSKTSQKVTYQNIFDDVDMEYNIIGNSLKESIILNQYNENFKIRYNINTNGLFLIEKDDRIIFVNELGHEIFNMEKLYMIDVEEELSHDVSYQIIEINQKEYQLIITPDNEWLKNASYPVIIDPTLHSSTTTM